MKMNRFITIITLCILAGAVSGVVSAYSTPESIVAASKVYISEVTYDPGAFFTGDTGTITVSVSNGNNNQSSVVNHVTFGDHNIRLTSTPYDSTTNIGPLQTQQFIFSVAADSLEGTYYPTFSMSFRDADSLYQRAMVQIDNTPLELTIIDKPDAFTQGKKKTIYMQVANPRKNNVRNVILEVTGESINASPSRTFIGDLASGAKIPVNFSVTPDKETPIALTLMYDNGDNPHEVAMSIPVTFGTDKKQADPVMSNVVVRTEGTIYHVTGDVNNAGLETANTVTVTVLSPGVPQDPYKTYVVGALKSDDFGSFEVTFSTDTHVTSVPVQLTYKDSDGNIYNSVQNVEIPSTSLNTQKSDGLPLVPILAGLVIVAIFIGGWFVYLRKNKK